MRISPLGQSEGEKDPWEVRLREMYQPQQERFLAAGYAALFLPSNSRPFHEMHLMVRGSLSWLSSLLIPWCPRDHLLEDNHPSGEAGLYLMGGTLSYAPWGP